MNAQGMPVRVVDARRAPAVRSAVAEQLRVVRTATPDTLAGLRAVMSTWARGIELPADVLVDLLLAVGEAAANVVDHAYRGRTPGPVEVDLGVRTDAAGQVVTARIADSGRWRSRSGPTGERGRGLPMIRSLASHLDVVTTARGTAVRLEIPVP